MVAHRDPDPRQAIAKIAGGLDAVPEVVVVDDLAEALGDRLEVSSRKAAVGGEALGEDEHVAALLGEVAVTHRQPPTDVGEAVLLRAHRHAVGERGDVADDVGDGATV